MSVINELITQIEKLRLDLIRIKEGRAYTDPEVVKASQKLDEVLNKYQDFLKDNKSDYELEINSCYLEIRSKLQKKPSE
ncbi:MAG TPA: aspartyl-phosphate phosphatase Spo0E family protein [Desulfosporosinus sp.]|nr:aspartyl-phosphate phosphatase Spo0E family protein [Desulfosporosinus sp.]